MNIAQYLISKRKPQMEERVQRLKEIGAPSVVVDNEVQILAGYAQGKIKVGGASRKHKGILDLEIISYTETPAVGKYYRDGKKKTTLLEFETNAGKVVYDTYDNVIGTSPTELCLFTVSPVKGEVQYA